MIGPDSAADVREGSIRQACAEGPKRSTWVVDGSGKEAARLMSDKRQKD